MKKFTSRMAKNKRILMFWRFRLRSFIHWRRFSLFLVKIEVFDGVNGVDPPLIVAGGVLLAAERPTSRLHLGGGDKERISDNDQYGNAQKHVSPLREAVLMKVKCMKVISTSLERRVVTKLQIRRTTKHSPDQWCCRGQRTRWRTAGSERLH